VIVTGEEAEVHFETKGYSMVADKSKPNEWSMAGAVLFNTEEERYGWLNKLLLASFGIRVSNP